MCQSLIPIKQGEPPNANRRWLVLERPKSVYKDYNGLTKDQTATILARINRLIINPEENLETTRYRYLSSYDINCWQLFEIKLKNPETRVYLYRNVRGNTMLQPFDRHIIVLVASKKEGQAAKQDFTVARKRFKTFLEENQDYGCR